MAHSHEHHHHHNHGSACGCGAAHPEPHDTDALVSARGLTLRLGGRDIVMDVDLDVRPGEIVTLIGPNGAGKSTLVKLILGIERPDKGSILKPASTRIGYVPQRFEVDRSIPMTVGRFLELGHRTSRGAVEAALQEAGIARTFGQQLSALSGGETQRVLIARALLRDPNLLVLDEPASGVDYTGEAELYELISALRDRRGLGVLLVSHDLHFVMAQSDRVLCLNGHVCCSGKPEAVAQHSEYVRIFGPASAPYRHNHDHKHDVSGSLLPEAPVERGGA